MDRFFQAPNEIFESGLNMYQKMVLTYLYRAGNNDAPIFPSYATIAEKCGMSRAKAVNTVKELKALGILTVTRRIEDERRNVSNLYNINRRAISAPSGNGVYPDNGRTISPGIQDVPQSTRDILPGTQDLPTGTQDVPTGTRDLPTGTRDLPAGTPGVPGVVNSVYPINNQSINNQYKETDIKKGAAPLRAVTLSLSEGIEYSDSPVPRPPPYRLIHSRF